MIARLLEHLDTVQFKIAAALCLVLAISIGIAMFGIWTYERDQFIDMANQEARRSGRTIEKALRAAMLANDREDIRAVVHEVASIYAPPTRISIINPAGRVVVSSDAALRGKVFNRFEDRSCVVCHSNRTMKPRQDAILIEERGEPLLRNVIKINNAPECHRCHAQSRNILGVLIYDAYFARTYELLNSVAIRMLFTGLGTFLVLGVVLWLVIDKFIHRPIKNLMQGFVEVGNGNFDCWVDEESSSEFGYMADQFNVMSRAIGRFIREIKGKNQETVILYSIVREVSETIELERLKKIIVDLVHEIFKPEQNGLAVPHLRKEGCLDIVWRDLGRKRPAHLVYCPDDGELSLAVITKAEVREWQRDQYSAHRFLDDYQRLLIPLHYGQQAMGIICVKKTAGQTFSRHERAIVPALANHVAISLANSQLYHMAITDGLTNLYSKRHLLNRLDILVSRHDKYAGAAFFLLMLDLDHFKEVNDTYGHQVGDEVLIQLADLLRKNIRFEDVPFRYGGEEFVILVPAVPEETALGMEIAERLREAVEKHPFEYRDAPPLRKTVSIGVACFPLHGKTAHDVIQAADEALYRAKRNGRNQVSGATG